jgi:hypothetical protein
MVWTKNEMLTFDSFMRCSYLFNAGASINISRRGSVQHKYKSHRPQAAYRYYMEIENYVSTPRW